jgi:putative transposase
MRYKGRAKALRYEKTLQKRESMGAYNRRPRLKSFDYKGIHRYFVTVCTHERMPLFANDEIVTVSLEALKRTSEEWGFKVWAFCFMPDHVHLLVEGNRADSDLRRFISAFKQKSGYYCRGILKSLGRSVGQGFSPDEAGLKACATMGFVGQPFRAARAGINPWPTKAGLKPSSTGAIKLWQTSYYDHVLRGEEDILTIARYIFDNPVRKKLVEHYRDYSKLGSFELDMEDLLS